MPVRPEAPCHGKALHSARMLHAATNTLPTPQHAPWGRSARRQGFDVGLEPGSPGSIGLKGIDLVRGVLAGCASLQHWLTPQGA